MAPPRERIDETALRSAQDGVGGKPDIQGGILGKKPVWVFSYGSLMCDGWETSWGCQHRSIATLAGFRRIFNKGSVVNWGTKLGLLVPNWDYWYQAFVLTCGFCSFGLAYLPESCGGALFQPLQHHHRLGTRLPCQFLVDPK
jgi:hypothetical protein